ncbi:MAG: hypothetical protein ABJE95_00395 [Byssovorax sp.]
MTPRTFSASLLLVLVSSLCACSEVVATPPDPQTHEVPPVQQTPQAAACGTLYAGYAGWLKACFGTEIDAVETDHLVKVCTERSALPGVVAPGSAIASCGAQIAASSCAALPPACIISDYLGYAPPSISYFLTGDDDAINHLFPRATGTLPAGATCDISLQCQSGVCSTTFTYDFDYTCGVCVDPKKPGEACDATTTCEGRSSCTDGVCKSWGDPLGSPCQAAKGESNCLPDLYCPKDTCVPRLHIGDTCDESYVAHEACPVGAVCSGKICQVVVEGKSGDTCDDIVVKCGSGMFCADGQCRAPVANVGLGGSCAVDVCAPDLRCNGDKGLVCTAPKEAGESCWENRECAPGLICPALLQQNPVCSPPSAEGQPCISEDACDNGLTCDGSVAGAPVCVPKANVGDACSDQIRCWAPLTCVGGICGDVGVCSAM